MSTRKITFRIITLFPEAFDSYLQSSIIGRALRENKIAVKFYNPRDFVSPSKKNNSSVLPARPKSDAGGQNTRMTEQWFYRKVDDKPYGGGPGMVLQAEPFLKAVQKALGSSKDERHRKSLIWFFDRSGKQFTNADARLLARGAQAGVLKKLNERLTMSLILICGHYEGIDARVQKILKAKKISIGPYTLTGGELPAMLVIDAVARQIEGVLGTFESIEEERISSSEVYTRPEILTWMGKTYKVPRVLLSGNHAKIDSWRKKHST